MKSSLALVGALAVILPAAAFAAPAVQPPPAVTVVADDTQGSIVDQVRDSAGSIVLAREGSSRGRGRGRP